MVVDDGVAVTVAPVVALRPVAGNHEYVEPPLAVMVVALPLHNVVVPPVTVTVGKALTVMVCVALVTHPLEVPVTVYVLVVVVAEVTVAPVVAFNPVAGLQVYVVEPDAVIVVDEPLQMADEPTATDVNGTVMVRVVVLTQPLTLVPVTVYVRVMVVLQVTVVPVLEFSPVAGDHE